MRVLVLHNRYQQHGGEDAVAHSEVKLLRSRGVEVLFIETDNEADARVDLKGALALAMQSHWSRHSWEAIRTVCREFRPDIAHVHNFWLRFTPAVHAACRAENVPTVQTLHNFRLFCTNAQFQRAGRRCEDCLGRVPWRGVVRRCYRHSFLASAAVARMIVTNRSRGTWTQDVSAFIALSDHSARLCTAGGIPESRIRIKPNFVEDQGSVYPPPSASNSFVFVGRLSPEKGVDQLLLGWSKSGLGRESELLIAGDGPERDRLERQARTLGVEGVTFLGRLNPPEVMSLLGSARAVIMPSLFHECFPRTLVEAMSVGRPIIASSVGALDELVDADMGLQYDPLDSAAMASRIRNFYEDPARADRFGRRARGHYVARYTPQRNFEMLMDIYDFAIRGHAGHRELAVGAAV